MFGVKNVKELPLINAVCWSSKIIISGLFEIIRSNNKKKQEEIKPKTWKVEGEGKPPGSTIDIIISRPHLVSGLSALHNIWMKVSTSFVSVQWSPQTKNHFYWYCDLNISIPSSLSAY